MKTKIIICMLIRCLSHLSSFDVINIIKSPVYGDKSCVIKSIVKEENCSEFTLLTIMLNQ